MQLHVHSVHGVCALESSSFCRLDAQLAQTPTPQNLVMTMINNRQINQLEVSRSARNLTQKQQIHKCIITSA